MKGFYYFLWGAYILGASGTLYLWWRIVKSVSPRIVRDLLLGGVFLLLFTPWFATPESGELAPAFIILLHDLIFGSGTNELRGLYPILAAFSLFIVLLIPCHWIVVRKGLNSSSDDGENTRG